MRREGKGKGGGGGVVHELSEGDSEKRLKEIFYFFLPPPCMDEINSTPQSFEIRALFRSFSSQPRLGISKRRTKSVEKRIRNRENNKKKKK